MTRTRLLPRSSYYRDARLFVVAIEGEVTEPWYFHGLNQILHPRRIRLEILASQDGLSSPKHVAQRLSDFQRQEKLLPEDALWMVVDVDRHKDLEPALREANTENWNIAVSNPCFEIWLQLHFVPHAQGTTSQEAKAAWGVIRNSNPGEWPFDEASIRSACQRAASAIESWVPPCPGSNVYKLILSLRPDFAA